MAKTVAQLIEELQKLPQDMEIYCHNDEFDSYFEPMIEEQAIVKRTYSQYPSTYWGWDDGVGDTEFVRDVYVLR